MTVCHRPIHGNDPCNGWSRCPDCGHLLLAHGREWQSAQAFAVCQEIHRLTMLDLSELAEQLGARWTITGTAPVDDEDYYVQTYTLHLERQRLRPLARS